MSDRQNVTDRSISNGKKSVSMTTLAVADDTSSSTSTEMNVGNDQPKSSSSSNSSSNKWNLKKRWRIDAEDDVSAEKMHGDLGSSVANSNASLAIRGSSPLPSSSPGNRITARAMLDNMVNSAMGVTTNSETTASALPGSLEHLPRTAISPSNNKNNALNVQQVFEVATSLSPLRDSGNRSAVAKEDEQNSTPSPNKASPAAAEQASIVAASETEIDNNKERISPVGVVCDSVASGDRLSPVATATGDGGSEVSAKQESAAGIQMEVRELVDNLITAEMCKDSGSPLSAVAKMATASLVKEEQAVAAVGDA